MCVGDEWVTSELKWITAVMHCMLVWCNVMGDELQSGVKILFQKLTLLSCRSTSVSPSLFLRFSFVHPIVNKRRQRGSIRAEYGTCMGVIWELHGRKMKGYTSFVYDFFVMPEIMYRIKSMMNEMLNCVLIRKNVSVLFVYLRNFY